MSEIIGSNTVYSTWGAMRTPLGVDSPYASGTVKSVYGHNTEYDKGFTATAGCFIRTSPYYNTDNPPPRFVYQDNTPPGSSPTNTSGLFYMWGLLYDGNLLVQDDYDQLAGETVTMTNGTFTLSVDAWDAVLGGQTVSGGLGSIVSIGKLTAF